MNLGGSPAYAYLKQPSMVDYPGYLAMVFFTSGCNFGCRFCHNAELLGEQQEGIPWAQLDKACQDFRSNWVEGAVISGGEPTVHPNLPELIRFIKSYGFKIKLDTNGSNPRMLKEVLELVDYVAMDIKCSLESYEGLTGYNNIGAVAESIKIIKTSRVDYEFRTTVLEKFHTDAEIQRIKNLVTGSKRYVIQPFLPRENLPDARLRTQSRTSAERLKEIAQQLQDSVSELEIR
ncbi:MAG: anaerobic ribonucleoside-triphosphate reductase activating protein [Deltaproteobacteria bacterium]|nr:anaerobic ribonucleoside-triphosphate reductase activating protein [Deltaproteobacteria bacterium]